MSQVEAIREAFAHHQAGDLDRAQKGYRRILDADPECAEAWHLLGALALQTGDATAAVDRLGRAVKCDRRNPQYRYNYAVALQASDRLQDAAQQLRQAKKLDPTAFDVLNNLGLVEKELGRLDEAVDALRAATEAAPTNAVGYNNLALALAAQGNATEAETILRRAIALAPDYPEAHNNLGTALRKQGRNDEAETAFRHALTLRPDYPTALFNLAGTLHAAGRMQEAAEQYRALLDIQPGHASARHLLNALEGAPVETAPADYVAHLFDGYADHFESHLVGALGYEAPQVMRRVWDETGRSLSKDARTVDLGCGTGLCAQAFGDLGRTLIGIDLSTRMVNEASEGGLYGEVVQGDAVGYLEGAETGIELALAGDVLIYLGDPRLLLRVLAKKLAPGGVFICSIESTDKPDFILRETGRFAHNPDDLEAAAEAVGLVPLTRRACQIRLGTDGTPIDGFIVALARPEQTD